MKQFGTCRLDTSNQCLWRDGVLLNVPPKPYAVLRYLVEHPDRLITHAELMDALWPETYVQQQVLRTYVLELRRLLGDDASNPKFIATVPKRGYRFLAAVSEVSSTQTHRKDANGIEETPRPVGSFVGREEELRKLESMMQRACGGERQTVFLSGDPGIGKTALLDAFCTAGCGDARVARGQSMERFGNKEPYYPVKEQLSELCGSDKGEKTARLLARFAPGWYAALALRATESKPAAGVSQAAAAPGPRGAAPPEAVLNTAPSSEGTLGEICDAIEAIAHQTPLLLAFEDVHWADDATIDLISALARRRTPAKLMMIATGRPGNHRTSDHKLEERNGRPHSLRTLKQELAMRRLCTVIELGPLKKELVAEYLTGELRRRHPGSDGKAAVPEIAAVNEILPQGLAAVLYQHSNGNPLFLSAIVDQLIADRTLRPSPQGWSLRVAAAELEIGVPENIREMIELEVEALSAPEQRLAEAASVVGTVFPVWAAATVLAADAAEVEERYEDLIRRTQFVHPAGHDELPDGTRSTSYVFAHWFYREVLYRRQPEVRRSRGHQRLAESLGRLFAGDEQRVAAEIAAHYEAAGNWMRAAESLTKIAEESAGRGRRDDAAKLLNRAIELLGNLGEQQRAPLEAKLAEQLRALAGGPAGKSARNSSAGTKTRRSSPANPVSRN